MTEIPPLLDARGTFCPVPILMTARRIKQLSAGERLEVVGDDPGIAADMPVWCEETGNLLISVERDGEEIRCLVEKA
jgi:TusA-related sulfurtransferase